MSVACSLSLFWHQQLISSVMYFLQRKICILYCYSVVRSSLHNLHLMLTRYVHHTSRVPCCCVIHAHSECVHRARSSTSHVTMQPSTLLASDAASCYFFHGRAVTAATRATPTSSCISYYSQAYRTSLVFPTTLTTFPYLPFSIYLLEMFCFKYLRLHTCSRDDSS